MNWKHYVGFVVLVILCYSTLWGLDKYRAQPNQPNKMEMYGQKYLQGLIDNRDINGKKRESQ